MKIIIKIIAFIKKQISDVKNFGIRELFRKLYLLFKTLAVILVNILAIVPSIIIRLISPWIIIRIHAASCGNFGNFVYGLALYYCKKKLNINQQAKKHHIDLFYISYKDRKIYNRQLAKMWKRKLIFLPYYLLAPINTINRFIPGWERHSIKMFASPDTRDIDNFFEKYQPLDFTAEEENYGRKMLNKFGLNENDKFVCLAVRDGGYQLKKISSRYRDWSYHDYRHTDIDKFILAAEELTKRGYYVFRMGVVVEKPFKSKNPKIIDYANSDLRSDFMDIYLGAKCSFCISTIYGFDAVPNVFNRPTIMLGLPLGDLHTYSEKFLLMTKHHVSKKEKRELSLSEIFSLNLAFAYDTKIFDEKGIKLVDNTPNEIKDLVIEMIEYLESNKKLKPEDEALQQTFKKLYAYNLKLFNYQMDKKKMHGQIRSRFSTKFLKQNRDWLN